MKLSLPPLHRGQRIIRASPKRFRVAACGRRWGKGRLGVTETTATALEGGRAWWIAPTYPIGMIGWAVMKWLARQIPQAQVRESEKLITYPGGGFEQVKSADNPDSLRGEGLDLAVLDEVAFMKKFVDIWHGAIRPALSDRQGRALFLSTPRGHNHFWDLFRNAKDLDEWASWRFPTADNPYIRAEEIDAAREMLPSLVFRQEYMAEFVQLAGALVQREWLEIIEEAPEGRYVRAWDLAASTKTSADFTAGSKMGFVDGDLIVADLVHGRWEWPDALKVISRTARADGPGVHQGIEVVGVQKGMLDMLMREPMLAGIAFSPISVTRDKLTRFMPFVARAEQGKVKMVRGAWNRKAIDEVCAFPEAEHDDIPDSMALACQMLPMVQGDLITLI